MNLSKTLLGIFSGKGGIAGLVLMVLLLSACGSGGGGDSGGGGGSPVLTGITVNPANSIVSVGLTTSFTATGNYDDGSTSDFTNRVTWSSNDINIATIDAGTGIASGVLAGPTTITASYDDGKNIHSDTVGLTVTAATLQSIVVTPNPKTVAQGVSVTYTATGTFSDVSTGDVSGQVTWSSNDACASFANPRSGIASTLTQQCTGATITATSDVVGVTPAMATLTVTAPVLKTLTIAPSTATIVLGGSQQYTVSGKLTNGATASAADWGTLSWVSGNTAVATIDTAGLAIASASTIGSTGISASSSSGGGVTSNTATLLVDTLQMGGARQGLQLALTAEVTTPIGSGALGSTDGTGPAASFYGPSGITTDGPNLYVSDTANHTIRKIVKGTGEVTRFAGQVGSWGSYDGAGLTLASFRNPEGITTDGTNLYVADTANHTIRKIVIASQLVNTLAGDPGVLGTGDGIGSGAKFNLPRGITTDGTNVYVADMGSSRIRKIVIATSVVSTLSTTGVLNPYGITTDGTNLYVANTGSNNILKIPLAGGATEVLAGSGAQGAADGTGTSATFKYPRSITTDGHSLFVTDTDNHTIRKISPLSGTLSAMTSANADVTTLAGTAVVSGSVVNGAGAAARFSTPYGITTDATSLFVVDNGGYVIRKID